MADDLDTAWDAEARGGGSSGSLDAATAQTLTRLTTLQRAADAPLSGRSRVWTAPIRSQRAFKLARPRFRAVHAYALVALLLLVTLTVCSLARDERPAIASATSIPAVGGQKLYRIDEVYLARQAMNPVTLADIPGDSTPGIQMNAVGASALSSIAFISADGSTAIASAPGPGGSVSMSGYVVYDARTMKVRRISTRDPMKSHRDQRRRNCCLIHSQGFGDNWTITGLKIFDTTTASVVASLNLASLSMEPLEFPIFDSTLSHAYVLSRALPVTNENDRDVQLTDYELASGKAVHQTTVKRFLGDPSVPLFDVPAGGDQVLYHGLPGISLSPDGQTLVLMSPETPQMTLIQTSDWTQLQTLTVGTSANAGCFPSNVKLICSPSSGIGLSRRGSSTKRRSRLERSTFRSL